MSNIFSSLDRLKDSTLNFANVKSGEASLFVDGVHYVDFISIGVSKSLNELVHSFTFSLVDKWRASGEEWPIKIGSTVKITFGVKTILSGYIDAIDSSFSNSGRNFSVSGRSKTCDLVDCSYVLQNQIKFTSFKQLAEKICEQFDIDVVFNALPFDEPFDFVLEQGETCFEALTRYAAPRGYFMQTGPNGELIIFNRDLFSKLERSTTDLIQGKNVIDLSGSFNYSSRFSEYTIKSQSTTKKNVTTAIANATVGTSKDEAIKRFRPKMILSDNVLLPISALIQAQWESDTRARQSMDVDLKVVDWKKADGEIWDIGELVAVSCPAIGINRDMLINSITYGKSNGGGTTCSIMVVPEGSFRNEPTKKDDAPAGWEEQVNSITLGGMLA